MWTTQLTGSLLNEGDIVSLPVTVRSRWRIVRWWRRVTGQPDPMEWRTYRLGKPAVALMPEPPIDPMALPAGLNVLGTLSNNLASTGAQMPVPLSPAQQALMAAWMGTIVPPMMPPTLGSQLQPIPNLVPGMGGMQAVQPIPNLNPAEAANPFSQMQPLAHQAQKKTKKSMWGG